MKARPPVTAQPESGIERASTLELFLDLVFVFTVTQLTDLVAHPHDSADYARAALALTLTWWIYSGYVWLTSNVAAERTRQRLLMFAGMFGFLLMALAIPGVLGRGQLLFGSGLLLVTLVHALLFKQAVTTSALAILRIAPFNFVAAFLAVAAAFVPAGWNWALMVLAVASITSSTVFRRESGFTLSPAHFVERHGLVVIVALGESVVAIGVGARDLAPGLPLAVLSGLALALAGCLWWSYFGSGNRPGEDRLAEDALVAADVTHRPRLAVYGFGYGHLLMIAGIVTLAAGIKLAVAHPTGHLGAVGAWNLSLGLALYLLGDVVFRRVIGAAPGRLRLLAALLVIPTALAGERLGGETQLGLCVLVMLALLMTEARLPALRTARA